MKKVFSGKVYEVLPLSNGIIFSYRKNVIEDKTVVAYKMINFDTGVFTDVAKNIYQLTKFGNNYKNIIPLCNNYITAKALLLPNNKVFLLLDNGTAKLIDDDSTVLWESELKYKGYNASDIVLYKNVLWASFKECDVLLRYSLTSMREELRIGGNNSPFSKPSGLFVEDDNVMVCNLGSAKLIKVNLNSYGVFDFEQFEEPVYKYLNTDDNRFVILDSGLYLI